MNKVHLSAAMRASEAFVLEVLAALDHESDLLDRILLVVIGQANLETIATDRALQLRYATLEASPPDDLRRPISISAVSTILRIPFETARRRIRRFAEVNICVLTEEGARLPSRSVAQPVVNKFLSGTYEQARNLYLRLKAEDCLPELDDHVDFPRYDGPPPVRIVARAALDHFLRMIEVLSLGNGGLTMAFVLLATQHKNMRSVQTASDRGVPTVGPRQPARASRIAALLKLPETTVRRRLQQAAAKGWCTQSKRGAVVTPDFASRPEYRVAERAAHTSLLRLLKGLQSFGVLALWDESASLSSDPLNTDCPQEHRREHVNRR